MGATTSSAATSSVAPAIEATTSSAALAEGRAPTLRAFTPPSVGRSGRPQAVAQLAVVGPVRAHSRGQCGVAAGLAAAAGVLERPAQAELGVVVDRRPLDH